MTALEWKSYGDQGRNATGDKGIWRIVTCGKWWHLTLETSSLAFEWNMGKFLDRQRAMDFAQEREDGINVRPRPEEWRL